MVETQSRVRLSLLVAGLVAVATVSMVVDRSALRADGRDLPAWAGPVLDATLPIRKAMVLPLELVRGGWSRYVGLVDLGGENERLRGELTQLRDENLQLREALVASGRLAVIVKMRKDFEIPMLPAEVVGSDVSPWFRSALLDRGRDEGVRAGMPVVSEQGLVGLVTATSAAASKAMLLLDRQTAIDGTIQRSRARGILRGTGTDALEFEFVARGGDVAVGDQVITSGLGGVFPKGLFVGEVTSIQEAGSRLMRKATVLPSVDFGRLEQAFVMLRRGPAMELLYDQEALDGSALE